MTGWTNWSGCAGTDRGQVHFARSVDDVAAVVAAASASGRHVRVAGSGHSHFPLVPTDDVIIDLSGLAGVIAVDTASMTATVWGGTMIATLGRPLHDAGVALANQGDIDRQTIAGAIATGTHGTGRSLTNLSAAVSGLTLVDHRGESVRCNATERSDLYRAARLGLGAFGVTVQVELSVVPAFKLAERSWRTTYAELRPQIAGLTDGHRHAEFYWYPHRDLAFVKTIDPTDDDPIYPVADEGRRVAWSYEVLPSHRARLHTETEFAVPVADSLDCLDEIVELLRRDFPDLRWPIEYRTVAADDVWLSQADGREVATISIHQGVDDDDGPLFSACERIARRYDGRPHWGKLHGFDGDELAVAHPHWDDWWARRDAADPDGVFLNEVLAGWRR